MQNIKEHPVLPIFYQDLAVLSLGIEQLETHYENYGTCDEHSASVVQNIGLDLGKHEVLNDKCHQQIG